MSAAIASRAGGPGASSAAGGAIVEKLAQLQNLIKRDPPSYSDEFKLQHRAFAAELAIFQLNPRSNSEAFKALVVFLAHVAPCYKKELAGFPAQLFALLAERADALAGDVRRTLVTSLILLRNRGLLEALPLFRALFPLLRVKDKFLRDLVCQHVIADVRAMSQKGHKDDKSVKGLQGLMYGLVADEHTVTAKRVLDVLVELHRRRVWTDARTINVIAGALTSERTKLLVTALKFFLGPGGSGSSGSGGGGGDDDSGGSDDDEDSGGEDGAGGNTPHSLSNVNAKDLRSARLMHTHSKSTRKRETQIKRRVNALKKAKVKDDGGGPVFPAIQVRGGADYSRRWPRRTASMPRLILPPPRPPSPPPPSPPRALQLLHDPQGIAERVFASLRGGKQRFEVRLLQMNLVSRLVGTHRLLLLPFYSYCQKYLAAHQAHVTQVLVCLIQACHALVPPDEVMPVVAGIANAFISDRSSPESIQVGLNALRNVLANVPTVLEEPAMVDLMGDLLAYRCVRCGGVAVECERMVGRARKRAVEA